MVKNNNNNKYVLKIQKKIGKVMQQFNMIKPEDHIIIALSGGKDSMILTEALAERRKHIPFPYYLHAVHVKMEEVDYKIDEKQLSEFCNMYNVPLYVEQTSFNFASNKKGHNPCFICSWQRRKIIFDKARDFGCNKIAFGHHMDDAIETLFMNMIYHGSISSLPQKVPFFKGEVEIIRPLMMLKEEELMHYAGIRNYNAEIKNCPHEKETMRKEIREILENIYKMHDQAKLNIFRSMDNIYTEYLPQR